MSRHTIRVLANGEPYAAGHDAVRDDAGVMTFTLAEGATDTFTVDWKGYLAGATPTASWVAGAGTLAGAAVSGSATSARLGGLSEGETATVTVTATSGTTVGVMRFRVACPDFNARVTGGI